MALPRVLFNVFLSSRVQPGGLYCGRGPSTSLPRIWGTSYRATDACGVPCIPLALACGSATTAALVCHRKDTWYLIQVRHEDILIDGFTIQLWTRARNAAAGANITSASVNADVLKDVKHLSTHATSSFQHMINEL